MRFLPVEGIPRLNTTPLATVTVDSPRVTVELDDENEARFRLVFEPYQAVRMVTADCYVPPVGVPLIANTMLEVIESSWVDELRASLRVSDAGADFMDKAHHYVVPLQDDFLEVVALRVTVEPAP